MRKVLLADHDRNRLSRPIRGRGGFQSLLRRIAGGIDPSTGVLEISEADAGRVIRYCAKYGDGGFQGRLGSLAAVLVARIVPPQPDEKTSSNFGKAA